MSGLFEMKPVRAAPFSVHIKFTDESEDAMSPQRHLDLVKAPLIITYGTGDSPEFQQQSEDFFAALQRAGKPAELIAAPHFGHMEVAESLASPFGLNGRAALRLMGLSPGA
jgi:arylformamidase